MPPRRLVLEEAHAAAGAVFEDALGWRVPAWYASGPGGGALAAEEASAGEYAAARDAAAIADLSDRGVLAITGPDRQKFLNNILSNDVLSRRPGQGCLASLMTVKGHLLALMRVLVEEKAVRLELPADRLERVEEALVHYRVAAPVRFAPQPAVVLGLLGAGVRGALARAGVELPELADGDHLARQLGGDAVVVARAPDLPSGALVAHVAPGGARAAWDALAAAGLRPLGRAALDALRVEAGRAWWGRDVSEENLLHETGLLAEYHSPGKGCYVGQEVVARLEARGAHVNKSLRGLRLAAPVEHGVGLTAGGEPVGRVTTAAVSPRLGPIALAYLHRSHSTPGTEVQAAGVAGAVVALPFEA